MGENQSHLEFGHWRLNPMHLGLQFCTNHFPLSTALVASPSILICSISIFVPFKTFVKFCCDFFDLQDV